MKNIQHKPLIPVTNNILKSIKSANDKGAIVQTVPSLLKDEVGTDTNISETAKALSSEANMGAGNSIIQEASTSATSVAKVLTTLPTLPIAVPSENKDSKKLEEKISGINPSSKGLIKKPAIIFIEGFSAFGISNGDGIKDMADNLPGAKRFSWDEQDQIIDEIKKHAPDRPVILVGHSFGGDSAVEIANTLNSTKNGFRSIDLLVSIDSVGMNNSIIPMNVKRNLNFFGEGTLPFLHGSPNVARDTAYSEVINELNSELHSRMDDSEKVQFKIFESINEVLNKNGPPEKQQDIFTDMQKRISEKAFIDSQLSRSKQ